MSVPTVLAGLVVVSLAWCGLTLRELAMWWFSRGQREPRRARRTVVAAISAMLWIPPVLTLAAVAPSPYNNTAGATVAWIVSVALAVGLAVYTLFARPQRVVQVGAAIGSAGAVLFVLGLFIADAHPEAHFTGTVTRGPADDWHFYVYPDEWLSTNVNWRTRGDPREWNMPIMVVYTRHSPCVSPDLAAGSAVEVSGVGDTVGSEAALMVSAIRIRCDDGHFVRAVGSEALAGPREVSAVIESLDAENCKATILVSWPDRLSDEVGFVIGPPTTNVTWSQGYRGFAATGPNTTSTRFDRSFPTSEPSIVPVFVFAVRHGPEESSTTLFELGGLFLDSPC